MDFGDIKREFHETIVGLRGAGLAVLWNPVTTVTMPQNTRLITWDAPEFVLKEQVYGTIEEYRSLLQAKQYSFVLYDGGIVQMSYTFRREVLKKHRLAYYPCPFDINLDDEPDLGLLDLVELHFATSPLPQIRLRPPLRFDFDEDHAAVGHSASHLHVARGRCRIPVHAPLTTAEFIRFIFKHFYYEDFDRVRFVDDFSTHHLGRCIQSHECSDLHLTQHRGIHVVPSRKIAQSKKQRNR